MFARLLAQREEEALYWVRRAAELGHAQAQYELARCYMLVGGRGDVKQAFAWLHKAAAEGHPAAQFELGWFYLVGVGAKTDEKQAVLWFVKAASQGYASTHSIRDEIRVQ